MPLLTSKQVAEVKLGKVDANEAPKLPPPKPEPTYRVRMHHPDTSERFPLRDFELVLGDLKIEVKSGIAEVIPEIADQLEAMSWRRGKQIPIL